MNTKMYLDLLKKKIGKNSNYAVSKYLKEHHNSGSEQTIANYDHGDSFLSDEMVIIFSKELDIPEGIIAADVHAERAKKPEVKRMWEQIASQLKSVAACCFLLVMSGLPVDNVQAAAPVACKTHVNSDFTSVYIMRTRKWLKRAVAWLVAGLMRPAFC